MRPALFLLLATLLLASDCRCSRESPEERARRAIDTVVKAVNERDVKPVAAAVSEQYSDKEGNDKQHVVALVRAQFLLHRNLYLVAKLSSLECPEPVQARAVVFAAMAAVPAAGMLPDLRNLSADVYRFDLTLADEDGTWRVLRAAWSPATVNDLL
jgi:hypothetical protein